MAAICAPATFNGSQVQIVETTQLEENMHSWTTNIRISNLMNREIHYWAQLLGGSLLGHLGLLDLVLCALWALRPCNPSRNLKGL